MASSLIINLGSTSKKYALCRNNACLYQAHFETTGSGFRVKHTQAGGSVEEVITAAQFGNSFTETMDFLQVHGHVDGPDDITKIGIRVVAPGERFQSHHRIDDTYIAALKAKRPYAPLHIAPVLREIAAVQKVTNRPLIALSDSAFHKSIPEFRTRISLPTIAAAQYELRQFGYHGLSVASVAHKLAVRYLDEQRFIVLHVGGGVSVTAVADGKSIDTSMGFTPASGMMMGGRGGDVPADAFLAWLEQSGATGEERWRSLYEECGFVGVTGVSDLRVVIKQKAQGDPAAALALAMFVHQIQEQIISRMLALGAVDRIICTGTAVFRNPELRALIFKNFDQFGISVDNEANDQLVNADGDIHHTESQIPITVLPTDEMGEMSRIIDAFPLD